jgi:hypothetical protein
MIVSNDGKSEQLVSADDFTSCFGALACIFLFKGFRGVLRRAGHAWADYNREDASQEHNPTEDLGKKFTGNKPRDKYRYRCYRKNRHQAHTGGSALRLSALGERPEDLCLLLIDQTRANVTCQGFFEFSVPFVIVEDRLKGRLMDCGDDCEG